MRQKRKQSIVNYGYEPSADEDDGSYEKSETERAVPVETFRRRNREKRRLKKNGCNLHDPLVVCGGDIMLMILSFLDAHSVASSLVVSCRWRRVACSDTIWSEKVDTHTHSLFFTIYFLFCFLKCYICLLFFCPYDDFGNGWLVLFIKSSINSGSHHSCHIRRAFCVYDLFDACSSS